MTSPSQPWRDSLIVLVLQDLFPGWEPPKDTGREWILGLCPFHGDTNPSASISFELNGFACHACGEKGDAIGLIMKHKEVNYSEAVAYANQLSPGSGDHVRERPARKQGRRVFGGERTERPGMGQDRAVPPGIRGRRPPWA